MKTIKNMNDTLDRMEDKLDKLDKLLTEASYEAEDKFELLTVKVSGPTITSNEKKILSFKDKWVDDGLHQGKSVEFWRLERGERRYFSENTERQDLALKSAIAFRDGDIEGYRAMHGGV